VYIVYLDVVSQEMTTLQLAFLQVAVVTACSCASVLLFEQISFAPTQQLTLSLLYLAFLATAFTTYIQTRFQKDTTPTRAVIIFSIEPVIAAALAYVVLDERLGLLGLLGGALILAGVLLSELSDGIPLLSRTLSFPAQETDVSP
jgi:drug/metabolite transporter (DMT)-like permease